jgi:hypothetical protein
MINTNELLDKYRDMFKAELDKLMEENGHNPYGAKFILESALDLAITDMMNEYYK